MRPWVIYALSDPRDGRTRYIGITFRARQRMNEHLSKARKGGRTHRDCWIRSLLRAGVAPVWNVMETGIGPGWPDAERLVIAMCKAAGDELVNHTAGGDGTPGTVPSAETRLKWSQARRGKRYAPGRTRAMLGKRHTANAKAMISAGLVGRPCSLATRRKLSAARKGKPISQAQRDVMSKQRKGHRLSDAWRANIKASITTRVAVRCDATGESWPSVLDAARALGVKGASVNQALRKGCRCKGRYLTRAETP